MKPAYLSVSRALLVATSFLVAATLIHAAETPAAEAPAPKPADAKPKSVQLEALERATALAKAGDFPAALAVAEDLRKRLIISDPYPDELAGTVLTLKKDYPAAEASFREMLKHAPESHIGRFNLAEVIFLQTRFAEAEKAFADLEADRSQIDPAFADLCRFKRIACWLAQGRVGDAEKMLPPATPPPQAKPVKSPKPRGPVVAAPDSPAVTYSRAAIQHAKGENEPAAKTVATAREQFGASVEDLFSDTFVEMKWGTRDETTGRFTFTAKK
jgi:tetratricopeptide (TPR) repeat protein